MWYLQLEGIHKMIESNSWLQTVPPKIRVLLFFSSIDWRNRGDSLEDKKKNAANEAWSTQQHM